MVKRARSKALSPEVLAPLGGLVIVLLTIAWIAGQTGENPLVHSGHDSYTLQAMAWRDGHVALGQNYPWLELAVYKGDYYVSFPPVPAIPMLFLSFFFGENTPSGAVALFYFLGGLAALYALLRRHVSVGQSTLWMVFVALGGSILSIVVAAQGGLSGGVWFQAQLLNFFLISLAFLLMDGKRKAGWAAALVCLALAIGCRPFSVVFGPVLLWMLLGNLGQVRRAVLPYLVAPAAIVGVLAAYNFARFGSPFEFGHKYLPELALAGEGMFIPARVPTNIDKILQPPTVEGGKLTFPLWGGWAVYLTNPMILAGWGAIAVRAFRRKADVTDALLFVTTLILALALLSHRVNGGYAYGTRYLIDLLPALVYAVARGKGRVRTGSAVLIGGLIVFNILGTVVFNTTTP